MILPEGTDTWTLSADIISEGGLVVFPTDTVYGVGCDPYSVAAIERVYRAKARSRLKALPLLLSGPEVLDKVSRGVSEQAMRLGEAFWPGALTIVVPKAADLPDELGSTATIAVRVPDHDGLRGFIRLCGGAIAATSANISGEPDALDAVGASEYLREWAEVIVDGGTVLGGVPSTVVDCTGDAALILREGPIGAAQIERALAEGRR